MKRILCMVLAVVLLILCVPATVGAEGAEDKISPELRALIAANPGGGIENGVVVEIFHHNPNYPITGVSDEIAVQNDLKAQAELSEKLSEIGYWEYGIFSVGRICVGLPYGSIEQVATLDTVDYINLPHDEGSKLAPGQKYDESMKKVMDTLQPETKVKLILWLAYNEHAYIGVPEPGENATNEQVDRYIHELRSKRIAYHTTKNEEYAAVIDASCEVENLTCSIAVPMVFCEARMSEVEKIASLEAVAIVSFDGLAYDPSYDPQTLEGKFEKWMYETKHVVKFNPDLIESGISRWDFTYQDYEEIYLSNDWALVYATVNVDEGWEVNRHICLGNRVLSWYRPGAAIYPYGYFVYHAEEDAFYPIDRFVNPVYGNEMVESGKPVKVILEPTISIEDYPGILRVLDELNIGALRGDADGDGRVTILDATRTQRYKACLIAETGIDFNAADADGDSNVTVLDATRIQRTIAEMCSIDGTPKAASPTESQAEPPTELYFDN